MKLENFKNGYDVTLGSSLALNENIGEKLPFNDYMSFHEKKQCRFYHRDRGEKLRIEILTSEKDILH